MSNLVISKIYIACLIRSYILYFVQVACPTHGIYNLSSDDEIETVPIATLFQVTIVVAATGILSWSCLFW